MSDNSIGYGLIFFLSLIFITGGSIAWLGLTGLLIPGGLLLMLLVLAAKGECNREKRNIKAELERRKLAAEEGEKCQTKK